VKVGDEADSGVPPVGDGRKRGWAVSEGERARGELLLSWAAVVASAGAALLGRLKRAGATAGERRNWAECKRGGAGLRAEETKTGRERKQLGRSAGPKEREREKSVFSFFFSKSFSYFVFKANSNMTKVKFK